MEGGCCHCRTPQPAVFETLTAWNCEKGAEWVVGGALQFHDFLLVNNHVTGMDMKSMKAGTAWSYSESHGAMVSGGTIVARDPELGEDNTELGITLPYSEGLIVEDVTFVNFSTEGM